MTANPASQLDIVKSLIRSALRHIRIRDMTTFNARISEANALLPQVQPDNELTSLMNEVSARATLAKAEDEMTNYARFLLMCQEPSKALRFLQSCRPCGLEDSLYLNAVQKRIEMGLAHCDDFDLYRERYSNPVYFGTFDISTGTTRGRIALEHFARIGDDFCRVLGIGPNDGVMERRLLEGARNSTLTVAELAASFDGVLAVLEEEYPRRITRHEMTDFYDWGEGEFDLIILYEVLEHLPDAKAAVKALAQRCAKTGTVLVSVPLGYQYIEASKADDSWYQHVASYEPETLRLTLGTGFKDVSIVVGPDKSLTAVCRFPHDHI